MFALQHVIAMAKQFIYEKVSSTVTSILYKYVAHSVSKLSTDVGQISHVSP